MSFMLGMVSLGGTALPVASRERVRREVPADKTGSVLTLDEADAIFCKVDLGAFDSQGFHRHEAGVAAVVGAPFFPSSGGGALRERGAEALSHASPDQAAALAASGTGNWAGAVWRSDRRCLTLLGDRLATRPVYWWTDGRFAAFATSLSALRRIAPVRPESDYQGLLEFAVLGYPLADRTPFSGFFRLLAGEVVELAPGTVRRTRHTRISEWPEANDTEDLPGRVLAALREAVHRRAGGAGQATTFLSGGLDSRVINQLLADTGMSIRSFNFSLPGSQDAELGRRFAATIRSTHRQVPRANATRTAWAALLADAARDVAGAATPAWSGDGGSVCAGFVYVEPGIIQAMRSGDALAAIQIHLRAHGSPLGRRAVRASFDHWASGRVERAIRAEIDGYAAVADPARRFFLFMVENDQRRHLDAHFESLLQHRQELWTPFLDGDFLAKALPVPVDVGVGHRLYDRWFQLLPESTRSVPWQTYPGHVPCPLPVPPDLGYQWSTDYQSMPLGAAGVFSWARLLASPRFPGRIFRRSVAAANLALHVARIRPLRGWLDLVLEVEEQWSASRHEAVPW